MKKLILVIALAAGLSGCANLQNAWNILTNTSVSPQAVYIARNAFDALEKTATNYIRFCSTHALNVACTHSSEAIPRLIPAVRAGRVARTNLTQFQKDNPGALGPTGLYNALISATDTLQGIAVQYNIGAAK